ANNVVSSAVVRTNMYPDECVTNQGRGIGHASNHTISISYSNRNTVCAIICGCSYLLSVFR
ncbi:hypothetical protein, partial [Streptococcus pyogenes]|uniref:hypothetical protein n=1 Tax=Streptococcus pyogenes TaxID=1314 RepID=UPI001D131B27